MVSCFAGTLSFMHATSPRLVAACWKKTFPSPCSSEWTVHTPHTAFECIDHDLCKELQHLTHCQHTRSACAATGWPVGWGQVSNQWQLMQSWRTDATKLCPQEEHSCLTACCMRPAAAGQARSDQPSHLCDITKPSMALCLHGGCGTESTKHAS